MQSTNTLPEGVINGKISQSGRSSSVERSVRDRKAVGSIPAVPTKREKESVEVEVLRAPPPARSAEKPFLYSAERCRLDKKKFEPTRFAKNANSLQLFFARAIFCACKAQFTNSLIGSSQLEPVSSTLVISS